MNKPVDVSVVIVNYNTFALTCGCIDSIIAHTRDTRYEIIVVDNASTECDAERFVQRYPDICLIRNKTNVGFGIANNQGMAIAKGTYFLLINSDCYLLNNAIDLAFRYALERPEVSVLGATLLGEDGRPQPSHFEKRRITIFSPIQSVLMTNPVGARIMRRFATEPQPEIGGLYGCYIWLHRKVYESVGGFDPDFFMYCEDTEWFRKRIAPRYKIEMCKEARVCHLGGRSGAISIVKPQNILSFYLYWYKMGKLYYWIYTVGSTFNVVLVWLCLPFMSKTERQRNIAYTKYVMRLLPTVLFDIPRYDNGYASREKPLKVN